MKPSILFIFITVTWDMIGIGLIIPSLPDIMRRFVSDTNLVSEYYGYFISLYALMQFLASPLLGAISDRVGRRPVLLVSCLLIFTIIRHSQFRALRTFSERPRQVWLA